MVKNRGSVKENLAATVVGVFGAYYWVRPDHGQAIYNAKPRGRLRIAGGQTAYNAFASQFLAIGDRVQIQLTGSQKSARDVDAFIIEVEPRRNIFSRASQARQQIMGANLDGVIVVASLDHPPLNFGFIDRVLAEGFLSSVAVAIVINKMDIFAASAGAERERYRQIFAQLEKYRQFGHEVFQETFSQQMSSELRNYFHARPHARYLLVGQSGVGKSTLLNSLAGKKIQNTAEVGVAKKGRHTTTNPALFELDGGIELVDIPGVREFGLMHRSPEEIRRAFTEFHSFVCRFENCSHLEEPGCAVKEALGSGLISDSRYQSYISIVEALGEQHKPRRGDYWRGIRH